ncbi:hypothetical protein Tco_1117553, partial [Tanacetum coccineum]
IIMMNVIPPDHDHDVPVVEPNQHDDAPVVPEPVLENKDKDPEEDKFEEEEDPQEEDDMEIDIEEDENEPYVYEVGESSTATIPREDGDRLLPGFMRRDIDSLFDLGNEARSSVEQGTTAMEKLVEKLRNVEEKAEYHVRAHEFYQEMIPKGFVFEERPNEAIDVSIEDKKSPLSEPRGSPPDV